MMATFLKWLGIASFVVGLVVIVAAGIYVTGYVTISVLSLL